MDKVIRDGNVAVLYSPGFGAGWYTWNSEHPELVFDPTIVAMIEQGRPDHEIEAHVVTKYGADIYCGGLGDLAIRWVPVGAQFRIDEYDGNESVVLNQEDNWLTA